MSAGADDGIFRTHSGDGPREVLALHCTLAHSGAWRGLYKAMADDVTWHAFDMPSHGRSRAWTSQDGDYQDVVTDIARGVFDRPMDLVGHSFGATVALRLAWETPELVRSLTLIEPVFFAVALIDDPDAVAAHDLDAQPFSDAYAQGDMVLAARLFNRMWSDPTSPRWPDLPAATRDAMVRAIHVIPATQPSIFADRAGVLHAGGLDPLVAPTRLLRGGNTHHVLNVINEGLARRLPNARSDVVQGAGHMLPITHPIETAAHIRRLFSEAPM